jgi:phosphopantetheine adenylyltransferase
VGKNPAKTYEGRAEIPESIKRMYQVDYYSGYLTDYLQSKPYNVTLVRGLRNSTDLQNEVEFLRWLQEDMPDVQMVSIVPDRGIDHVSSSGIKKYEKGGKHSKDRVQE